MTAATELPLAVGIDMGGTSVKYGVVRGKDILRAGEPIETDRHDGPDSLIAEFAKRIAALRREFPEIVAAGVGVPGFVDVDTGIVHELTNVPGWIRVPLVERLSAAAGLPVAVENDANAMCYAEFVHGAGRGARNLIGITLGTGVGGGLVLDGRLFRGSNCGAGEVGQMTIDFNGPLWAHGNPGAIEGYIGNDAVEKRAAALYRDAGRQVDPAACEPRALAEAAGNGEPVALAVWDDFTTRLAASLSACVWLLNPDRIVIGGGISKAGSLIFDPLRRKMVAQLAEAFHSRLTIVPAEFGNDAGILGSAAVALAAASR